MILTDGVHLVSDSNIGELHNFAASIGLHYSWFQNKRIGHYDLTTTRMSKKAELKGAVRVSSKELIKRVRRAGHGR